MACLLACLSLTLGGCKAPSLEDVVAKVKGTLQPEAADAPAAPSPAGSRPPPEVGFMTLASAPFTLVNELPGRTAPHQVAEVRPQVTGIIEQRLFREGQSVTAGQPLYQIDDAQYRAAVENARAELAVAQAAEEAAALRDARTLTLSKSRMVSEQDRDDARTALAEAKARVAAARAMLRSAEINLAYTTIRAPIAGRIGRSAVTPGALVTANQASALAAIRELDPIYVDVAQSFEELAALKAAVNDGDMQGMGDGAASVTLLGPDGRPYAHEGELMVTEYAVDEDTGSVTLRALFPNPELALLPGMFVRAQLPQATLPDCILAPQKAIGRAPTGEATAWVLAADNTVEQRTVRTGRATGSDWIIEAGLVSGDRLIVDGLQKLRPGMTVTPVPVAAPARDPQPPAAVDRPDKRPRLGDSDRAQGD